MQWLLAIATMYHAEGGRRGAGAIQAYIVANDGLGSRDTFKQQGVVYRVCYLHLDSKDEAPPVILYKCYMLDSTSLIMSVGTLGDSTITAQYSIWYFLLLV